MEPVTTAQFHVSGVLMPDGTQVGLHSIIIARSRPVCTRTASRARVTIR